ncbi:GGDEF domain-containing protein [Gynuella sunshinyii]|uniref:diguanylate cyclase n=1 Tax=Gynuella sunshinyii YC6258 TaxID=1445510 RepID=A0A0C5VEJ4_9GAMM|nr:GGDEF domain-containing protein [Gynuella sunshinyii]AJQ92626.1 GGDEF domain [Gynuella sunshinyii YC6258]
MEEKTPKFSILDLDSTLDISITRRIIAIGCLVFVGVWITEIGAGLITEFDAIGYPICIAALLFLIGLSYVSDRMDIVVRTGAFSVAAVYLILLNIWGSFQDINFENYYSAATAMQWLPLIYVIAFLFLRIREALIASAISYFSLLIGQYLALSHHLGFEQTWPLVTNLAIAHFCYVVVLWSIIKLRATTHEAQIRAKTMEKFALVDELTGIFNRRGLELNLDKLRSTWRKNPLPYTIFMIDIDHFKRINDQFGHLVGDEVLARVSAAINKHIRPEDVLGRWGGEEFMIITTRLDQTSAVGFAERLLNVIETLDLGHIGKVTASIGIANSDETETLKGVILKADQSLYKAKKSGRNQVVCSSSITPSDE